jgi:hypothetical protein
MKFLPDLTEYAQTAERQRKLAIMLADKIEKGEEIESKYAPFIGGILRFWASNLPDQPKRKPGRAPKMDPMIVALHYAAEITKAGKKKSKLLEELSENYDVSLEAIKGAVASHGKEALDHLRWSKSSK